MTEFTPVPFMRITREPGDPPRLTWECTRRACLGFRLMVLNWSLERTALLFEEIVLGHAKMCETRTA